MKRFLQQWQQQFQFFIGSMWKDREKEITISAAASLNEVLSQIAENYQKENKNITVNINFGASGALKNKLKEELLQILYFLHLKRFGGFEKAKSGIRKIL